MFKTFWFTILLLSFLFIVFFIWTGRLHLDDFVETPLEIEEKVRSLAPEEMFNHGSLNNKVKVKMENE